MTTRRAITAIAIAAGSLMLASTPAQASERAAAVRSQTVASASWSVVATLPAGTASGPLILQWSVSAGSAYQRFDLSNSGNITVTSFSVSSVSASNQNGNVPPPNILYEACVGGVWTSISACSGTVLTLASGDAAFTVSSTLSPGSRISVRATTRVGSSFAFTTTISTAVTRSSVRFGLTTNS